MSGSRTIIAGEGDRLDNVHPGDVLREDFLVGSEVGLEEVARGAGIDSSVLLRLVGGEQDIDASLDARLTRYFGLSDGYFLRLQNSFDMEEVRRREGAELDRIVPRAA